MAFVKADFCDYRGPKADVIIAIESFVCVADAEKFWCSVNENLNPGGYLVVFEDFEIDDPDQPQEAAMLIERFRRHWRLPSVIPSSQFIARSDKHGLHCVHQQSLTDYIKLRRPRDRFIHALLPLLRLWPWRSAFVDNMVGGDALQSCLLKKYLDHRFILLQK